jgi:hypothetical protein
MQKKVNAFLGQIGEQMMQIARQAEQAVAEQQRIATQLTAIRSELASAVGRSSEIAAGI